MNFLLKIVEGPNKGAEIALVEGVAVTLGKGDDCDIVLADATLPDTPLNIEASADGVVVNGEPAQPFHVKTFGATSFAVGPADAPWGGLEWPSAKSEETGNGERGTGNGEQGTGKDAPATQVSRPASQDQSTEEPKEKKRRGGLGCLVVLLLLLLILAVLGWFFRDRIGEMGWVRWARGSGDSGQSGEAGEAAQAEATGLSAVAAKYGLSLSESEAGATLSGNLKTRRERLAATAEAYQEQPGVNLDISDDESFRMAAEDALFTLTEGALKVAAATNRVVVITGVSRSPGALKKTLESLNADMPRLRNVDVGGVRFDASLVCAEPASEVSDPPGKSVAPARRTASKKPTKPSTPALPVCGILTTPYPCLVMRDGRRILEGAAIGENTIVKIEADYVVVTNSLGRFELKP